MTKLVPFTFETSKVRAILRDGEAWFILADVCRVLEIGNPSDAAHRLDEDEKDTLGIVEGSKINGLGTIGAMPTIINESGLYALILTSRKPAAKRFRKWVTAEVLPSIRKTGRYDTGNERRDASVGFQMMCETLQGSRKASGKDTKPHHYINEARMINAALTGAFQGVDRSRLARSDLDLLIRLEHENEFLLRQEKPYAERKTFLVDYANSYRQRVALKAAKKAVLERRPT